MNHLNCVTYTHRCDEDPQLDFVVTDELIDRESEVTATLENFYNKISEDKHVFILLIIYVERIYSENKL